MPTEKEVCDRLDIVTATLSTNIRTLAIGVLAFTSSLLLTAIGFAKDTTIRRIPTWFELRLFCVAALAFVVLLCDVLQYLCVYMNTRNALERLELKTQEEIEKKKEHANPKEITVPYNEGLLFRGSLIFFALKNVVLIWATLWLAGSAAQLAYQQP